MALIIADRVKESATTTGTGTFTLGGAITGFRTFNAGIGTGNTTYYCIFLDGTGEYEVGLGTFTAPDQLARDTVLTSSNSGSKVNFSAGIKSVFCTQPSSKAAFLDASGNLSITTSNVTEGTNLYYTDARFDTRLATKDTANLTEGTNLYFTDARARAAISVSGNALSYNSSTGVITSNFEESPTFTGNVVVSGNLTVTGTTTWLDSTNTQISDKNIVLNYASSDSSANADGAGITIQDAVDASTDASLTWNASNNVFEFSHGLDFGDNERIRLGASQDLQIYHDGSNSYIKDGGTGNLLVLANDFRIRNAAGNEDMLQVNQDGEVKLSFDGTTKLATTSTGIDVTGDVVADGIIVDSGGTWASSAGGLQLDFNSNTGFVTTYYDTHSLTLGAGVSQKTGITIHGQSSGTGSAVTFRTGNSEKARIDSSGRVGIGTSSPSEKLHVSGTTLADKFTKTGTGYGWTTNTFTVDQTVNLPSGWARSYRWFNQNGTADTTTMFFGALGGASGLTRGYWTVGDPTSIDATGFNTTNGIFLLPSGDVGIGTTSPDAKLSIDGGTDNLLATFKSTDDLAYISFQDNGTTSNTSVALGANDNNLVFFTGTSFGSERARIDSSGNLLVGTTGVPDGTSYYGAGIVDGGGSSLKQFRAASSTTTAVSVARWYNPNGNVGSIQTSGSSTSYATSSDARLKDITGEARGLEVINELNPVAYDWKADGNSDEGLIAQEVKELVPNAVSETEEGYYQMDYSKLVTPLIKAVQELTAKVENLEAQLADK